MLVPFLPLMSYLDAHTKLNPGALNGLLDSTPIRFVLG